MQHKGAQTVVRRKTKLRILQIGKFYPPHKGGIETHFELLCNGLSANVTVDAVAFSDSGQNEHISARSGSVYLSRVLHNIAGCPVSTDLIARVRQLSTKADIVHLHHPNPMGTLALVLAGYKGPTVVTYHSDVVRQRLSELAIRPLFNALWNRTSAFIVLSPNYITNSRTLVRNHRRCHVIPSAIDFRSCECSFDTEEALIRAEHGDRIILAVGRLVGYKGYSYLLQAMKSTNARLLLIGTGPLHSELQNETRALGLEDKVRFLGHVANVVPYYRACDLFVLPSISRAEAFGLVQVEAMACGKPVVNTDLPSGVPFVSRNGETGLTVPPKDPRSLAAAITLLLDDDALRRRLGEQARHRAYAEFSAETMITRTLDLYNRILSGSERKSDASDVSQITEEFTVT